MNNNCKEILYQIKNNSNINKLANNSIFRELGVVKYFNYSINSSVHIPNITKYLGEPCSYIGYNGRVKVWYINFDDVDFYITYDKRGIDYHADLLFEELFNGVSSDGNINIDNVIENFIEKLISNLEPRIKRSNI